MKTKQIFTIIVIVMMGLQMSVFAQENKNKPAHPDLQSMRSHENSCGDLKNLPPIPLPVLPGIPNLSKEQSETIHKLQIALAIEKLPMENSIREKEAKLQTISTLKTPDMKEIEKQIDEIGIIKVKFAKMQASHDQDIRKVLDDEQRMIFDKRPPMLEPRPF